MKDAGSSLPQDKAAILSEIQAHSQEEQVNEAVEVLILAGMSTPSLRLAAARGAGCIRGAGQWRSTAVAIPFAVWVLTPLSHIVLDISCGGALLGALAAGGARAYMDNTLPPCAHGSERIYIKGCFCTW
jgi:hypothetical protein